MQNTALLIVKSDDTYSYLPFGFKGMKALSSSDIGEKI
jgi:hypothetical protein